TETLPACDHRLAQGDSVAFDNLPLSLSVLDVPGHTAGHIAYHGHLNDQPILFCGDTLFAAGCGRLFEGTPAQMHDLLASLSQSPRGRLVCWGREDALSNLARARAGAPGSQALASPQAHPAPLRQQKQPPLPSTIGQELATNP